MIKRYPIIISPEPILKGKGTKRKFRIYHLLFFVILFFMSNFAALYADDNAEEISEENFFDFRLWGYLRSLSEIKKLNKKSLRNPDDSFNVNKKENKSEAAPNINGNISKYLELTAKGKLYYSFFENKDGIDDKKSAELNQGFISLKFDFGDTLFFLSAGKQRLKLGTGYFWNPVDTFNLPKDIQDVQKPYQGKILYRADIRFPIFSLTGFYVPVESSTETNINNFYSNGSDSLYLGKVYTFLGDMIDLSFYISGKKNQRSRFGTSFSLVYSDIQFFGEFFYWKGQSEKIYITKTLDRLPSYDPIGDTNFTVPAVYSFSSRRDNFYKILFGLQYTFSNDLTVIGEYYYNKDGYDKKSINTYLEYLEYGQDNYQKDLDSLLLAKQQNPNMSVQAYPSKMDLLLYGNSIYSFSDFRKNYFHLTVQKLYIAGRYDLNLDIVTNIDDMVDGYGLNMFFRPSVEYIAIQNWTFMLYSQIDIGSKESEYGMLEQNYTVFFEIKWFF